MNIAEEREAEDKHWMQRAVSLGYRGWGTTSPNPPVGAVIVKDGCVLGEGFHERAGEPHAERRALADARARGHASELRGATIYVTLEPCSSYGRTPPCTDAILESGITRVVYGAQDPDPRHQGRADGLLRAAGIDVSAGVEQGACKQLLRPWIYATLHRRPWVLAKVACTLDGSMARKHTRWVSSPEALAYAHECRLHSDAILVGGQTVRSDDPSLTIRQPLSAIPEKKRQPWRIVLTRDPHSLPPTAKVFTDANAERTLVYSNVANLPDLLAELYSQYGIITLMLECGGHLLRSFLEEHLVNEWVQDIAPILAGNGQPMLPGGYLPGEAHLEISEMQQCGVDRILRGVIRYS